MSALTHAEALAAIKDGRVTTAALIVQALPLVAEQLLIDAQTTDDPDLRRKIFETLQKSLDSVEPKQQATTFQVANFVIELGENAVQTRPLPPPEDVIDLPPQARPKPAPALAIELDDMAESLLGAADD